MSYSIEKGKNLRVKVNDMYVACATDCTLKVSANVNAIDTDHKDVDDENPAWEEQEVKGKSWSVDVSALYSTVISETTKQGSEDLVALVGQTVSISFDKYVGGNGTAKYTGSAVCTEVTASGSNGSNASVTATFTGNGKLSPAT